MTPSTVAVCVPTLNRAALLGESLRSLLRQEFRDLRIFVVDSGSTDDTAGVVSSLSNPRVQYVPSKTRLAMTENWNRCVELALDYGSPFIALYHDDDIYYPGIVQREVDFFRAHPRVGIIHTAIHFGDGAGRRTGIRAIYPDDRVMTGFDILDDLCRRNLCFIAAPSVMARREAYQTAGRFDPSYRICPDLDMWWRMAEHFEVGYIAQPQMLQRIHGSQASISSAAKKVVVAQTEFLAVLDNVRERISAERSLDKDWYRARMRRHCAIEIIKAGIDAAIRRDSEFVANARVNAPRLSGAWDIRLGACALGMMGNPVGRQAVAAAVQVYRNIKNAGLSS